MTLKAVAPQQRKLWWRRRRRQSQRSSSERVGWGWGERVGMPGATPAWCEWERARAPGCVLLADIHGSCSGSVRECVCVCVLVVLYWQRGGGKGGGNKQEREEGRARTGWRAREGFAAVSLPPQLDPVVKAEREAGWVRLAAYGRRREWGRRGDEARRGGGRQQGPLAQCGPFFSPCSVPAVR